MHFETNSSDQVSSFLDMLNSEYSEYEELARPTQNFYFSQRIGEEKIVEATPVPSQVSPEKAKEKRARTKNFTKQEDEMLIPAWESISLDSITGSDQTNGTYWQRIQSYFMKHKYFKSDRSITSLTHRWSVIQLGVNKFQGFYNQFDGRSGFTELDKVIILLFWLIIDC